MQEREYQAKQVEAVIKLLETHNSLCIQLPTGGGKTVEFSTIIKKYIHKLINIDPGPTLILVHREELLYQTEKAIKEVLGFQPCLITSKTTRFYLSRCYIGMVDSTMSRLHMIVNPSLIIIDECHIDTFKKVHEQFKDTKRLGFSATPISVSKNDPLKNYYEEIIEGPQIKDLINMGYLSQNITRSPSGSIDPSKFEVDRLKGDYNERIMAGVYRMSSNISNVIDQYFEFCLGTKTLIFNVNIEHSKEVNECFNFCGYPSRHLDASCKDRKEIFKWFKETPNAILNSVGIPTMGFDEPTIQSIILNFSTLSLPKFIQTSGRGSRMIDEYFIEKFQKDYPYELKTKSYFNLLDLGQNWKKFGDWNNERDWRRIFWHPGSPGEGIAPTKSCPECSGLVHAATRLCPLTKSNGDPCLHEFHKKDYKQMDLEEMVLITKGIDVNKLVENSDKKYKYYAFIEMAIDVVENMFLVHGENPTQSIVEKHFRAYYKLCVEWYQKTLSGKKDQMDSISDSGWHIKKAKNTFNSLIEKRNKNTNIITQDIPYELVKEDENYIKTNDRQWKGVQKELNW